MAQKYKYFINTTRAHTFQLNLYSPNRPSASVH